VTPDAIEPARLLSLRATSSDHHARLLPIVERLRVLAEMIGEVDCDAIHGLFEEEYAAVTGQLVPHMEAIESVLYGQLEQLMGRRHSMAPMRDEHAAMRALIEEMGRFRRHVEGCRLTGVEALSLRRALYRLYSILKVHLAEEELYLGVLEQHLTDEQKDTLARGIDHAMRQPL
jgi:iron-sulfur cluster repair protein YtfE (RIC family)